MNAAVVEEGVVNAAVAEARTDVFHAPCTSKGLVGTEFNNTVWRLPAKTGNIIVVRVLNRLVELDLAVMVRVGSD